MKSCFKSRSVVLALMLVWLLLAALATPAVGGNTSSPTLPVCDTTFLGNCSCSLCATNGSQANVVGCDDFAQNKSLPPCQYCVCAHPPFEALEFGLLTAKFGIPWLITSAVSAWLFGSVAKFRPELLKHHIAANPSLLTTTAPDVFANRVAPALAALANVLAVLLPVVFSTLWGVFVAVELTRGDRTGGPAEVNAGLLISCGLPSLSLATFSFMRWRALQFNHFDRTCVACSGLAAALLSATVLCLLALFRPISSFPLQAFCLAWNMAAVVKLTFSANAVPSAASLVQQLLVKRDSKAAAGPGDGDQNGAEAIVLDVSEANPASGRGPGVLAKSLTDARRTSDQAATDYTVGLMDMAAQEPRSPAAGSSSAQSRLPLLWWGVSLLPLVALAISSHFLLPEAPELGLATAGAVLILDMCMFAESKLTRVTQPVRLILFLAGSRVILISFNPSFWFLAHALMFLLMAAFLIFKAVNDAFPTRADSRDGTASSLQTELRSGGEPEEQKPIAASSAPFQRLVALSVLTACFIIELIVVAVAPLDLRRIAFNFTDKSQEHEQWLFGLAVLFLALSLPIFLTSFKLFAAADYEISRPFVAVSAGGVVFVVVCGIVFHALTSSDIVLALATFEPLIVLTFLLGAAKWIRQDFYTMPQRESQDQARTVADFTVIGTTFLFLALIVGQAVLISSSFKPVWIGWAFFSVHLTAAFSWAPVVYYFNTFAVDAVLVGTSFIGFASVVTLGSLFQVLIIDENPEAWSIFQVVTMWASVAAYPVVIVAGVGVCKWIDDGYKMTREVVVCLSASSLLIVTFSVLIAIIVKPWTIGVGMLLAFLLAAFAVMLLFVYVAHNFYLPRPYRLAVFGIVFFNVLVGLTVAVLSAPFLGISFAFFSILGLCVGGIVSKLHGTDAYHYTEKVFPVHVLSADSSTVRKGNGASYLCVGVALCFLVWSCLAALFIEPYHTGLFCILLVLLSALVWIESVSSKMAHLLFEAQAFLSDDAVATVLQTVDEELPLTNNHQAHLDLEQFEALLKVQVEANATPEVKQLQLNNLQQAAESQGWEAEAITVRSALAFVLTLDSRCRQADAAARLYTASIQLQLVAAANLMQMRKKSEFDLLIRLVKVDAMPELKQLLIDHNWKNLTELTWDGFRTCSAGERDALRRSLAGAMGDLQAQGVEDGVAAENERDAKAKRDQEAADSALKAEEEQGQEDEWRHAFDEIGDSVAFCVEVEQDAQILNALVDKLASEHVSLSNQPEPSSCFCSGAFLLHNSATEKAAYVLELLTATRVSADLLNTRLRLGQAVQEATSKSDVEALTALLQELEQVGMVDEWQSASTQILTLRQDERRKAVEDRCKGMEREAAEAAAAQDEELRRLAEAEEEAERMEFEREAAEEEAENARLAAAEEMENARLASEEEAEARRRAEAEQAEAEAEAAAEREAEELEEAAAEEARLRAAAEQEALAAAEAEAHDQEEGVLEKEVQQEAAPETKSVGARKKNKNKKKLENEQKAAEKQKHDAEKALEKQQRDAEKSLEKERLVAGKKAVKAAQRAAAKEAREQAHAEREAAAQRAHTEREEAAQREAVRAREEATRLEAELERKEALALAARLAALSEEQENRAKESEAELEQKEKERRLRDQEATKNMRENPLSGIVARLRAQNKSRFVDPDFPASDTKPIKGVGPGDGLVWLNAPPKPLFQNSSGEACGPDNVSANAIMQGNVVDTDWFLAAVSSLAERDTNFLKQLFVNDPAAWKVGLYGVRVFKNGVWLTVPLDTRFPCSQQPGQQPTPLGATPNEGLWAPLLEKSQAKLCGGYGELSFGVMGDALSDLTGQTSAHVDLTKIDASNGKFWASLKQRYESGFVLGAVSRTSLDGSPVSPQGIYHKHSYSILQVAEVDGNHLLELRNPMRKGEWKGNFGDTDKERWTRRLTAKLKHQPSDDGKFWIELQDFILNFASVFVLRTFPSSWRAGTHLGQWGLTTAGGPMTEGKSGWKNPHFRLLVSQPATIILSLTQEDARLTRSVPDFVVGLGLFAVKDLCRIGSGKPYRLVATSGFSNSREVSVEVKLQPGIYVVVPATQEEGQQKNFVLSVHCQADFSCEPFPDNSKPDRSLDQAMAFAAANGKRTDAVIRSGPAQSTRDPTVKELGSLSLACQRLWDLDSNRLTPGKDYTINVQNGKKAYDLQDRAKEALFTTVSPAVFERPTFKAFIALLDNYERHTGIAEKVTAQEQRENDAFLNAVMSTPVMQYAHKWLKAQGLADANPIKFKRQLHQLWFELYKRGGRVEDSCGFEHVFVGEVSKDKKTGGDKVIGFHNWLMLHAEEKKGALDYRGYILPRKRGKGSSPGPTQQLLTIQFLWGGIEKSVSSTFVGTSPEFEFALYTMCFMNGEEHNLVEVGPYSVDVVCYRLRWAKHQIATSYPEAIDA